MKLKEQTLKELDGLNPSELCAVYDLIISMKTKKRPRLQGSQSIASRRVRESLKLCKGSFSADIINGRADRI